MAAGAIPLLLWVHAAKAALRKTGGNTVNNKLKIIGLIHISIVLIFCTNCQPAAKGSNSQVATSNTTVTTQSVNTNATPVPTVSPVSEDVTGSLATPTDTYKT